MPQVNASACSIYFLDNTEKSLFAARAKRTARGQLHEHFHLVHAMAGEVCTSGKPVRVDLDALKVPLPPFLILSSYCCIHCELTTAHTPWHTRLALWPQYGTQCYTVLQKDRPVVLLFSCT